MTLLCSNVRSGDKGEELKRFRKYSIVKIRSREEKDSKYRKI